MYNVALAEIIFKKLLEAQSHICLKNRKRLLLVTMHMDPTRVESKKLYVYLHGILKNIFAVILTSKRTFENNNNFLVLCDCTDDGCYFDNYDRDSKKTEFYCSQGVEKSYWLVPTEGL